MEENQERSKLVQFGDRVSKKASKVGTKINHAAQQTIDHLNFLKYFSEHDKKVSDNEKEKAIKIIEAVKGIKDDEIKAEVLKKYIDSNNSKEIIEKIIFAVKYLGGAALIMCVAVLLRPKDES
ncbi:hypothetical protein [Mesobacillus selenatarsenatis]|uniref:Uncharacterized protein n=1 Tax=Mesobacillus selenatarsenatis TaxID=388741 RepID=A0A846TKU7_9BACI|nr:hypothetical protein [Mesobacillus selenatarsenatis]NKE04675.1 hypothetical protein [Mesobacillus selenatarsenatis]